MKITPDKITSHSRTLPVILTAVAILLLAPANPANAAKADRGESFLKNGDRWLFVGDSITNTDTYRKVILHILQHYHPEADILIGNSAVNGVNSDYKEKRTFVPTVVTIMLGMNDVIHQDWSFTPDLEPKCEAYRASITKKIREYKAMGAEVILMTPTYTDERFPAYFNIAMTRRFLEAFGQVVREMAAAEKCHWIPVGEEMEAFQDTLGIDQHVRPDGVHPYGLGQYQIARSLYSRMNLAGRLTGKRQLREPVLPLDVGVRLDSRFMNQPADGITLKLRAANSMKVEASWSMGTARGKEILQLGPEESSWQIPVPKEALALNVGSWGQIVVELYAENDFKICIIDLARVPVLKMKDGIVEGTIETDMERPEGKTVCTWKIEERENELWFSGEVTDSDNVWKTSWPFMRDGVQLWLDLRPPERFAGINPDRDVSDTLIKVRKEPFFSVTPVYWIRPRLMYSSVCGGTETPTGYRWHYGICGNVTDARKIDIRTLDYFAFNMKVCDNDNEPKKSITFFPLMKIDAADQMRRLNLMVIVDRKGVFSGDETTNLHLFQ